MERKPYSEELDKQKALDGDWGARLRLQCELPFSNIVGDFIRRPDPGKEFCDNFFNAVATHLASEIVLFQGKLGALTLDSESFEQCNELFLRKIERKVLGLFEGLKHDSELMKRYSNDKTLAEILDAIRKKESE